LSDAKSLTHHLQLDKQPDIVARWMLYLEDFNFTIEHIPGKTNPADFLSRVSDCDNNDVDISSLNNDKIESDSNIIELQINNVQQFRSNNNLSYENILKCQLDDTECKQIFEQINNGTLKSPKYFIDDNSKLLMIKIKRKKKNNRIKTVINKILLPKSLIKTCISEAHGPHFGISKTFFFINKKYYWSNAFLDVKNFCNSCHECLKHKSKPTNILPDLISKSHLAPGELIAIDIVGRLPRSTEGHFYILTVIDHYSRYLEAIPLTNTSSLTIIKALTNYFARFGVPKSILSDNGSYLRSNLFVQFLQDLNIEHRKSSVYYPASNGVIERSHRSLKESIAAMCKNIFEWSERLLYFKLHYNNSLHSITQCTPANLFFGRELNLPMDTHHPVKLVEQPFKYLQAMKKHINETKQLVQCCEDQYFSRASKFLKGRQKPVFEPDDLVYLQSFTSPGTFQPKFNGPFKVIKKFRNHNYLIQDANDATAKMFTVNSSKLVYKCKPRPNLI
jgi:hypothetical protein